MSAGTIINMRHPGFKATTLLEQPEVYLKYKHFYDGLRAKPPAALLGFYSNPYRNGELVQLVDRGDRFVGLSMPTRSGKGVSFAIPNGFAYAHSGWWTDPRKETGEAISYYRRHILGQLIFCIDPFDVTDTCTRWNPADEVRDHTVYEVQDALTTSTADVDPDGTGFDQGDAAIWKKRARDLASALKLHMKWSGEITEKSYRTLINMITLPNESLEESARLLRDRLIKIRDFPHDMKNIYGFRDLNGSPTKSHPYIASCLQQQIDRPPNEAGSVLSEMLTYYSIYRDPIFGNNTAVSDMGCEDSMHGLLPSTTLLQIAPQNLEIARSYIRLFLNMRITKNMRDVIPGEQQYNWKDCYFLDEFTMLGKLSLLARQLAYAAGYGMRFYIIFQDIASQLYDTYGQFQPILSALHAFIFGYTSEPNTAKLLSDMLKNKTIGKYERSTQHGRDRRVTMSEKVEGIPFMQSNDIMSMDENEAILRLSARHPFPIKKIPYYEEQSGFMERVALWSRMGQLPDRIPAALQVRNQRKAALEREYIDFCRTQSNRLQFSAQEQVFNRSAQQRELAVNAALAQLGKELVRAA